MSGIDIEPGSGTKIVNSLNLNNVKIKNTDYFGIVGNLVNNYNINNCDVDSPSIQNAIINDSTFTYLNKVGYSFNNNKLENSKIYFFAPEQTLFIFDSLINNSIIEGLNETKGNRLGISMSTVITNSTIKNMKGRTGDMALSTQNAGIMYDHNGYGSNIKSQNNVYDNCNMMFNIYYNESNLFNETNSVIKNSYIGVYGREFLNFEKITFENNRSSSYISSTFHPVITFKDCKIIDSGKFGPMKKVLVNSKLIENGIELDSLD